MDALLKAYAEKRRKDADPPLEVPLATRRLVQAEVARQKAPAQPKPSPFQMLIALWPRLGLAVGLFVVLGTLVWVLGRFQEQPDRLAKLTDDPGPAPEMLPLEPPKSNSLATKGDQAKPPSAPAIVAEPMPESRAIAPALPEAALSFAPKDGFAPSVPPPNQLRLEEAASAPKATMPLATPKPAAPSVATLTGPASNQPMVYTQNQAGYTLTNSVPLLAGRFVQWRAVDEKSQVSTRSDSFGDGASRSTINQRTRAPQESRGTVLNANSASVLTNFNVEQSGDRLKITDHDGSVYEGALWQEAAVTATATFDKAEAPPALKADTSRDSEVLSKTESTAGAAPVMSPPGVIQFQVRGTNLTSRQPVTFRGSFAWTPAPAAAPVSQPVLLRSLNATATPPPAPVAAPASTLALTVQSTQETQLRSNAAPAARIQGKARLGDSLEWDIQAVPKDGTR